MTITLTDDELESTLNQLLAENGPILACSIGGGDSAWVLTLTRPEERLACTEGARKAAQGASMQLPGK